jgi:hypothetical protein
VVRSDSDPGDQGCPGTGNITPPITETVPPSPTPNSKKTKKHAKHASPAGRIPSLKVPEITGLYPFVYRHKSGCGGDAFLMTRVPDGSEKISDCVSSVGHLNGDPMSGSERVKCETCGKSALPLNIDYLERVA